MPLKISITPSLIIKYLIIGVVVLTIVSTGIQIGKYVFDYREGWTKMLNLDREMNLPTWYTALMLGFCALLLRIIAKGKKPLVKLVVLPEAQKQRRLGGAKDVVIEMAEDFDAPLDDFVEYMHENTP